MKFLFTAKFANGDIYHQGADDVSIHDASRSAYYDVVNYGSPVVQFFISNNTDEYGVDLSTGHFFINGTEIRPYTIDMLPLENVELFYAKRNEAEIKGSYTMDGFHPTGIKHKNISVLLGWKAKSNGKDVERIMEIDND